MARFRLLLLHLRSLAFVLVALAFATKILIPAGYMLAHGPQGVILRICSGVVEAPAGAAGAMPLSMPMAMGSGAHRAVRADAAHLAAMRGEHGHASGHHDGDGDAGQHQCAYTALAMASMVGADIVPLPMAIAFVMLLWLAVMHRPPVQRSRRWQPPSRAPPAAA